MANYLKKAIRGASYVFVLSVSSIIISYFFRLLVARNLSTSEFGLFHAVMAFTVLLHTLHDPGLKSALIKFVPEFLVRGEHKKINDALKVTLVIWLGLSAIFSLGTILFADELAAKYFNDPAASSILILLAMAFLLQSIDYLAGYLFQGFQRMGLFAGVDFSRSVILLLSTGIGFSLARSILVPAAAYVISSVVLSLVYWPILKKKVFPALAWPKGWNGNLLKNMVWFGIPVTLSALSYTVFQQVSSLALTYFGSLEEVGLLNVALPTAGLLISFSSSIAHIIFPLASELWAQGYREHIREGIQLVYRFAFLTILPLSLGLFGFSQFIINLLFGAQYANAAPALMLLSVGALFWIIAGINFNLLAGMSFSREPVKVMLLITFVNTVLNFLLIPWLGLMGACIAIVTGYFLAMVLSISIVRKHVQVQIPIASWLKSALAGLVFLGVVFTARNVPIGNQYFKAVLTLAVASVVYIALIFALKVTSWKEIKQYALRAHA